MTRGDILNRSIGKMLGIRAIIWKTRLATCRTLIIRISAESNVTTGAAIIGASVWRNTGYKYAKICRCSKTAASQESNIWSMNMGQVIAVGVPGVFYRSSKSMSR